MKQSARRWNNKLVKCLRKFDLHPTNADPCVFVHNKKGVILILIIHVDDGAIASNDQELINDLINFLELHFAIKVENLKVFLGFEINYLPNGSMLVNQKLYAETVVKRFRMENANCVRLPADPNSISSIFETRGEKDTIEVPFKEAIGSLMFLANATRPDIAFAVGALSRHAENPTKIHWNCIKRVIKYIKGTSNYGLIYKAQNNWESIITYSDANFASDHITRKSVSGFVVKLDKSVIAWGSRKQSTVSLSTRVSRSK